VVETAPWFSFQNYSKVTWWLCWHHRTICTLCAFTASVAAFASPGGTATEIPTVLTNRTHIYNELFHCNFFKYERLIDRLRDIFLNLNDELCHISLFALEVQTPTTQNLSENANFGKKVKASTEENRCI
jgi:hypothetical protein